MKKIIRIGLFMSLLAIAGSLSAQTMINGGFKVTLLLNDGQADKAYAGYYAGLTQNITLSRHIGVAPGVYFSRFTGDNMKTVGDIEYHDMLTENEIAIPVPINVMLHITDVSMIYIYGGPEFNVGITSKSQKWINDEAPLTTDLYEQGVPGELGRFNISWIAGVGSKFDFLNVNIGLSGNFFNRLYQSNVKQKAFNVFMGIGLAF